MWAQRANEVYLTVNVTDLTDDYTLKIEPTSITFNAKDVSEKEYAFHLDLYAEVNPDTSKTIMSSRSILLSLDKKKHDEAWWPRLLKEKIKLPYLKTDFARWKDEDESDEENLEDPMGGGMNPMMGGDGGFDFSQFANMPGMGDLSGAMAGAGAGAGGEEDSDDEDDMPNLESAGTLGDESK